MVWRELKMKLKKIIIKNYRQLQDTTINFDEDLTILAGANNSGKTSVIELFKRLFQDKNFSKDDVYIVYYEQLKKEFIKSINDIFKKSKSETTFRELIKSFYSEERKNKPIAIEIKIEIQYNRDESIALFSDYLMELDDECTSFYFSFNYEINISELIKSLSLEATNLYDKQYEIQQLSRKKGKNNEKLDVAIKEYNDTLFAIFDSKFANVVYFTDKEYKNEIRIGIKEFQALFKYNYLKATRLLNDEKTDNHFSISKELLNHFKQSDDWEDFKVHIIKDIKTGLESQNLNEKVKEHSLVKAQKALADIEKYFDYNRGEFSLQTDISDEHLMEFLSSSLQTFFEFKNGVKLKEFSQGLGISNLIYICLKVEAFTQQYQTDIINLFVIEEPEAHMHPQMERMLVKFINEILKSDDKNRVQGVITTHSNEIIKCSDLKSIRILRINNLLQSNVYDMNQFKDNLDTDEERQFFNFLFSINFSDLIFANKIIMYEGDTEKLYIEKLLLEKPFEELSNQYISYIQVGGAYTHWYRKLVYFLNIKTLIITDIDYNKYLTKVDDIRQDSHITNAGLIQYYKDSITLKILDDSILPYCENKCRKKESNCIYQQSELNRISRIQSDLRKKPCKKIRRPNYSIITRKPTVGDINAWIESSNHSLLKIVSQGEDDCYTRTLEEAMLCCLLNINVETCMSKLWWTEKIEKNNIKLSLPKKRNGITVRNIIDANKNKKIDFIYSIILAGLQLEALPHYIKEGLEWLKK